MPCDQGVLRLTGIAHHFAPDPRLMGLDKRQRPGRAGGADQSNGHLGRNIEGIDKNLFVGLEFHRETDKQFGKLVESWVVHGREF